MHELCYQISNPTTLKKNLTQILSVEDQTSSLGLNNGIFLLNFWMNQTILKKVWKWGLPPPTPLWKIPNFFFFNDSFPKYIFGLHFDLIINQTYKL